MDNRVNAKGFNTSEFMVLVAAPTLLVLAAPLVGYAIDPDNIKYLLLMYSGYGASRAGLKITSVAKQPKKETT